MIAILLAATVIQTNWVENALARPVDATHKRYNAKDDKGVGLDCLSVESLGNGKYVGVHHALIDGVFQLRLVESIDLLNWKHVRVIDTHAHQGTLFMVGEKWLMAWEKDGPNGNWIRVTAFDAGHLLVRGTVAKQIDLPRHHSQNAEGTPSIRTINYDNGWDKSKIGIRFHYWRGGDVDRQAEGVLTNFRDWTSTERKTVNQPLESTYRGNIGDRTGFSAAKASYEVLEAQYRKNDWASWRILLSQNGAAFKEIAMKSDKGSTSFANPAVASLILPNGKRGLFVSYFLPSQGNAKEESGQLVFSPSRGCAVPWQSLDGCRRGLSRGANRPSRS